jgi:hypothetical protein
MLTDMSRAKPAMPRLAKLLAPLIIAALTLALFDLIGYFLVPASYTTFAPSYRNIRLLSPPTAGPPEMARPYPRYYHRADDVLGFDITPGARAMAEADGHPYEIFANQLGCFDRNELRDFQGAKEYFYFAGDSSTWGYAPYESKFATVWERETGKVAAKCGVTHSGTLHEFEKFKRTAAVIGKYPKVVFVGFTINDPANDLVYPHTTVIDGYQVDIVFLKDGVIVRPNIDDVRQAVESRIRELESAKVGWVDRLKTRVWVYSLSANLVNNGRLAMGNAVRSRLDSISLPAQGSRPSATTKFGDSFYYFFSPNDVMTRYSSDPRANASKEAIGQWARHARDHSYKLVFLLFPPKSGFNEVDLFTQVKAWLDFNGIEYMDFAQLFSKGGYKVEDLYWNLNGHWTENGNRIVGRLLSTRF